MAERSWRATRVSVISSKAALLLALQEAIARLPAEDAQDLAAKVIADVEKYTDKVQARKTASLLKDVPLFQSREDTRETAIEFFSRHYSRFVDTGIVFTDDLRRHDARLYETLTVHQVGRGKKLSDLLPSRRRPVRSGRHKRQSRLAA